MESRDRDVEREDERARRAAGPAGPEAQHESGQAAAGQQLGAVPEGSVDETRQVYGEPGAERPAGTAADTDAADPSGERQRATMRAGSEEDADQAGERRAEPRAEEGAGQTGERRAEPRAEEGAGLESAGLLPWHEAEGYRRRWETLQARFVDDPRACVEQADSLVIDVLRRMAQVREEHLGRLRGPLGRGEQLSTEELRRSMQQYRAFFEGLLRT
jgi:hypothetical protein